MGKKESHTLQNSRDESAELYPTITDSRFASVHCNPRFARPKKRDARVAVDDRFKRMLQSDDFTHAPRVDKYGRKRHSANRAEELKRYYRLEQDEVDEDADKEEEDASTASDVESHSDQKCDSESPNDLPVEKDKAVEQDDIRAKARKELVDRARGIGVDDDASSSSSSSDSEDDEDGEQGHGDLSDQDTGQHATLAVGPYSLEHVPTGDETRRFAAVNLDWDHVKASDLYKVFDGFLSKGGRLVSVKIYPSDFGLERMANEAVKGPPSEIFKKSETADKDEEELARPLIQADDGEDFDNEKLRRYQMERLRYYYAVVEADSVETAQAIYNACDGVEYEKTSNYFDLRYIPDEMEFGDREPRDEAVEAPRVHKHATFATTALQHSKVKLTWDDDDPDRTRITRRKFNRNDIAEMDFETYLASESSGDESEAVAGSGYDDDVKSSRNKYKTLLEGVDDDASNPFGRPSKCSNDDEGTGDMEITFTPGISASKGDSDSEEETTIERLMRKEKEKTKSKKEARKAAAAQREAQEAKNTTISRPLYNDKSLALLLDDDTMETPALISESSTNQPPQSKPSRHFDMKEIIKAEKIKETKLKGKAKKKLLKKAENAKFEALQEDFELNLDDPRFNALKTSHHFAVDPSNPHFNKTPAMKKLVQHRGEAHIAAVDELGGDVASLRDGTNSTSNGDGSKDVDLKALVASVKRKSTEPKQRAGKRVKPSAE
ncbi:hypothetical protein SeLEV6574_g04648 [Synchytrium endobioticum]|uniref:Uncharacterized protein n=1 Tax=Synchytrium endobioticum TaxID=286115 RepID=A0A507CYF4_9FUNG|nr:hypothetical protein SeLEV6574_g04648 [Synchytrium endobioticum]